MLNTSFDRCEHNSYNTSLLFPNTTGKQNVPNANSSFIHSTFHNVDTNPHCPLLVTPINLDAGHVSAKFSQNAPGIPPAVNATVGNLPYGAVIPFPNYNVPPRPHMVADIDITVPFPLNVSLLITVSKAMVLHYLLYLLRDHHPHTLWLCRKKSN